MSDPAVVALAEALADRYRLERELGHGGMATVWLARDLRHERAVAIKLLRPQLGAVLGAERFLREIRLTANLQHPHILPLLDSGEAGGQFFYVMPYVEGESLRRRLQREGQLPLDEALRLAREVAEALDYAHQQGIVHRDIKPENILLSRGHALVADFGIALAVTQAGGGRLTETGLSLGTPAYMSPEQAMAEPRLDGRSDQYSLACVLYEMLASEPPYTGPTAQAIIAKRLSEPVPHLSTLREVPPGVEAAVTRALARSPADRFATVSEFVAALSAATPPRRWKRAAALVVALGLGAWLVARGHRDSGADAPPAGAKMLAVLPFKNLGAPEDQYFADGLTEEITSRLAAVNGLGVISRTSADQYRNTPKSLRQVGQELSAGYVLEGSVRWEKAAGGSRVRVTPQLIRVSDDRHLWADRYDAELADVFKVQGDIAEQVTGALNVALGPTAQGALASRPTKVPEAYDYYLRGQEYSGRRLAGIGTIEESNFRTAAGLYGQAIGLDSNFALAWAALARVHDELFWDYYDRTDSRLAMEREAAERATHIDSDLPEGHLALGYYYYHGHLDYPAALKEFERARSLKPQDSEVIAAIGYVQRRQGKWAEAMESLRRAAQLDPRSKEIANDMGMAALVTREYQVVDSAAARLRSFNPDLATGYVLQGWSALGGRGDTTEAAHWLREGMARVDSLQMLALAGRGAGISFLLERDPKLRSVLDRVAVSAFYDTASYYNWKAWLERRRGARRTERAYWDSLRVFLQGKLKARPDEDVFHSSLGTAYAGLGYKPEAIREARRGLELMPLTRDAFDHTSRVYELARVYVMVGEPDSAMDQIEHLATIPSWYAVNSYRYLPDWDPLRNNARFQRFLAAGKH
jgi:serine/threonine-protein kinase